MEKMNKKANDIVEETNEIKLRSEATSLFDVQPRCGVVGCWRFIF
jgi:hypothetical protein